MAATISGLVVNDLNGNGIVEQNEPGLRYIQVYVDSNGNGTLDRTGGFVEPDDFAPSGAVTLASPNISLSLADETNRIVVSGAPIVAKLDDFRSTGNYVFGWGDVNFFHQTRRLRMDFVAPVSSISLDFIGARPTAVERGRLVAYDAAGNSVGTYTTEDLIGGEIEPMVISSTSSNIAYAIAYTDGASFVGRLDNLRVDDQTSERWTITDSNGEYAFPDLPNGTYALRAVAPAGWTQTRPAGNGANTVVLANDEDFINVNFGLQTNRVEGTVFRDLGIVGTYEPAVDIPIEGARVYFDRNSNGRLDRANAIVEPDGFGERESLDSSVAGVRVSMTDFTNTPRQHALAVTDDQSSTGSRVFGHLDGVSWTTSRRLRADFEHGASSVSIDFIGSLATATEQGIIFAYDAAGEQVGADLSEPRGLGQIETLTVELDSPRIAYLIAYTLRIGPEEVSGRFDNLRASGVATEPAVKTAANGTYRFSPLADGSYVVRQELMNQSNSVPAAGSYTADVSAGDVMANLNFGVVDSTTRSWQNPVNRLDVNNNGDVVPLDALLVINELNDPEYSDPETGRLPPAPDPVPRFVDVDGDGFVAPRDALLIINFLNENPEGEFASAVPDNMGHANEQPGASAVIGLAEPDNDRLSPIDDQPRISANSTGIPLELVGRRQVDSHRSKVDSTFDDATWRDLLSSGFIDDNVLESVVAVI
jgi:hypothetical protein